MSHDPRLVPNETAIADLRATIPDWISTLERPTAPTLMPRFGPLEGIRVVGTGVLVAQPYIGTKLAEFGAEVIHIERPGGDIFRFTAPQITRGPRPHGADSTDIGLGDQHAGADHTNALERAEAWHQSRGGGAFKGADPVRDGGAQIGDGAFVGDKARIM